MVMVWLEGGQEEVRGACAPPSPPTDPPGVPPPPKPLLDPPPPHLPLPEPPLQCPPPRGLPPTVSWGGGGELASRTEGSPPRVTHTRTHARAHHAQKGFQNGPRTRGSRDCNPSLGRKGGVGNFRRAVYAAGYH